MTGFLKLLQLIAALVNTAEQVMPGVAGAAKKSHVLETLGAVLSVAPTIAPQIESIKATAAPLIDLIVGTFKALGHFSSSTATVSGAQAGASGVTSAQAPATSAAPAAPGPQYPNL